jgi:HlyD family secretion protein
MKVSISSAPAQSRQVKQRLANPEESLSYELGKAVQELPPLYTRLLAGTISLLVFGTLAWAHLSKVDEVAPANGQTVPSTEVRPYRAGSAGSIRTINVKEGSVVNKGDVMIEMDDGLPQTEVERLEKSAKLIQEDLTRLEAERTGGRDGGTAIQDQLLQARLRDFDTKQAAAIAEANRQISTADEARVRLVRLQENLENARINVTNAATSVENARTSLANAQEKEQSLRKLLDSRAVPQLDYLTAKDQVTQASNRVTEAQDRLTDARDKVTSIEKEIDAQREKIRQSEEAAQAAQSTASGLSSQRQSEILTQLTKRSEELSNVKGQLATAQRQRDKEVMTAPFDGTVYSVKATRGPVQAGEELLSLLPKGEPIVLEVKVLNRDIGFIRPGMRAKVKLATFPYQEFGIVEGEVTKISPNSVMEKDENGRDMGPVFPTRIKLNKSLIRVHDKDVPLTPGMAATAEIVTRQKSVLQYMIEPITRRFDEAFSGR